MRTTIDRAGRLVVPRELRDRLKLVGGETVELTERDGVIEISVAPTTVDIVDTPSGVVATPRHHAGELTDEMVRETLERVRR
jgi:AbrB family looped-hinge helix DNA binding protein